MALFSLAIVFFSNWFTKSSAGKQTRYFSAVSIKTTSSCVRVRRLGPPRNA